METIKEIRQHLADYVKSVNYQPHAGNALRKMLALLEELSKETVVEPPKKQKKADAST